MIRSSDQSLLLRDGSGEISSSVGSLLLPSAESVGSSLLELSVGAWWASVEVEVSECGSAGTGGGPMSPSRGTSAVSLARWGSDAVAGAEAPVRPVSSGPARVSGSA